MSEENVTATTDSKTIEAAKADQVEIVKFLRELNRAKDTLVQTSVQQVALHQQIEQTAQRVVELDRTVQQKVQDAALTVGINPKQGNWSFDYNTMLFTSRNDS